MWSIAVIAVLVAVGPTVGAYGAVATAFWLEMDRGPKRRS